MTTPLLVGCPVRRAKFLRAIAWLLGISNMVVVSAGRPLGSLDYTATMGPIDTIDDILNEHIEPSLATKLAVDIFLALRKISAIPRA